MRYGLTAALVGVASIAGIGAVSPALAGDGQPHIMNLRLPDGRIAQIRYIGDTPPRVAVLPVAVPVVPPVSFAPIGFGPDFASLERLSAMMDRQAEMMLRQAAAMQQAAVSGEAARLPPGTQTYSVSSSIGGSGFCMRSVRVTYTGDATPRIESYTAGNCGPVDGRGIPAEAHTPAPVAQPPVSQPRIMEVKADTDRPMLAMAQPGGMQ